MRKLWLLPALALLSLPLLAWNPSDGKSADRRKADLRLAMTGKDLAAQLRDKQARARQPEPAWANRTAWRVEEGGRVYLYGVGVAPAAIHNRALRVSSAELRARAAIAGLTGATSVEREEVDAGTRTTTQTVGDVSAEPVDWWEAEDGSLHALVVEIR